MKSILIALLISVSFFQQGDDFKPTIKEFKGYLHEVYGNGVYFTYFTKEKKVRLNFIYDSSSKSFSWNDSNVIMIFYGSAYPAELKQLYHNKDLREWFNSKPDFPSKEYTCINKGDKKNYFVSTVKSKFTAFDYVEYKEVEKKYAELYKWGIYTKHHIYPDMVKSRNKTFIVNYWK
jgi:hypothetical protein